MNGSIHKPRSLSGPTRLGLYLVGLGVWLSGGLWLLLHHFFLKRGEFGPEVNPAEPWCLKAHGAFAFTTVWLFGLLWGVHVTKLWPFSWRRWSGAAMVSLLAFLTLSGYLLYYAGDDKSRSVISALHWVIGLASPVFFLSHRVSFRGRRASSFLGLQWSRDYPPAGVRATTRTDSADAEPASEGSETAVQR